MIYRELKKKAMGIVNQLFDLVEVPVEKRQELNDKADEYMVEQLMFHNVSNRRELLKAFMKHLEKGGAISFKDYDYSIRNFEEENKSLL